MHRLVVIAILLVLSAGLGAQKLWTRGELTHTWHNPRWGTRADFGGPILFCRGHFEGRNIDDGNHGWNTDYPGLDQNFLLRLAELTTVQTAVGTDRQPIYVVLPLDSPLINRCPLLFMSDPAAIQLGPQDVQNLRQYLDKGGFLWFDDFWGSEGLAHWEQEMRKLTSEPILDIPTTHPIMTMLFAIEKVPQSPHVQFWLQTGGETSERGEDSKTPHFRGIQDTRGRLMIVATHNTDVGDTIEEEQYSSAYARKFSPAGYGIALNILLYALMN